MENVFAQKREPEKKAETASSKPLDTYVCMKEEPASGAGVPLFMEHASLSSSSIPATIQRQPLDEEEEEETVRTKADVPQIQRQNIEEEEKEPIQTKLIIGQPDDQYEQEADRVADEVMRMPEPKLQRQSELEEEEETLQTKPLADQITSLVQRQEQTPEEEEELQNKSKSGEAPTVTPSLESRINSLKGGGQPLQKSTRAFFEPRFGVNLNSVRVHTDVIATESARALNAWAYTIGQNIVFAKGQYSPGTINGKRLLAHELTHVAQQNGGGLSFSPRPQAAIATQRVYRSPESTDPIEKHTSWWGNLHEEELGAELLPYALQGEFPFVVQILDRLDSLDRAQVSLGLLKKATVPELYEIAKKEAGRQLLDKISLALTEEFDLDKVSWETRKLMLVQKVALDDLEKVKKVNLKKARLLIKGAKTMGWKYSSENLEHYLEGNGYKKVMSADAIQNEEFVVRSINEDHYPELIKKATELYKGKASHALSVGGPTVTILKLRGISITAPQPSDLYFALGTFTLRSEVTVKAIQEGGEVLFEIARWDVYGEDDYNWHETGSVSIPMIGEVYDTEMKKLAEFGLAHEYPIEIEPFDALNKISSRYKSFSIE